MSTDLEGLNSAQARQLLLEHGPNDLRSKPKLLWLRRFFAVLSEPTLLVLVVVLLFYVAMGSKGEAALLGVFVAIVIGVTYAEETRTHAAVEALASFASPRALALRDGQWRRLPGLDLVPGDLLNIGEGDRVAADALVLESHDFRVDESLLTGESLAAFKQAGDGEGERTVYAGTLVLQGQALARVTATGKTTRMGRLSLSLAGIEAEPTPFQRSISKLVRTLAVIAAAACIAVVALNWLRGLPLTGSILQGLTLAIATVPEELPVILAVFLAMGARRLSKLGVLATKVPAVETLGAVTLLAVDKTGTLTRNEMTLTQVLPLEGVAVQDLLRCAAEACEPEPFDPMERAVLARSGKAEGTLTHEYALSGRPPRMGHVWDGRRLAVKGAVEGVLQHCDVTPGQRLAVQAQEQALAAEGLRVLGLASGALQGAPPQALPSGLRFLGLLAFEDPLREGVAQAIGLARQAGIRVVMMTGDSVATAAAIAGQIGLPQPGQVVLGEALEAEPGDVPLHARDCSVFARMAPEHKLILVKAWSKQGEVVGMTGDGVNDAPAIAQAHVGIGLGLKGTDVAREAASLVLTDDSFISLIKGVELGRQVTRRIVRASLFVLAVHVPIIGLVLACLLLDLPPMIEAAQIAFLELFIGPTCSVVFERSPDEKGIMASPPRDPKAALLSWRASTRALVQGLAIFAAVLYVYLSALHAEPGNVPQARAEAFFTLLAADFMLCWTLLSKAPFWARERWTNGAFWAVTASVLGFLALLLSLPWTAGIFHMAWLTGPQIGLGLLVAALAVLWNEAWRPS